MGIRILSDLKINESLQLENLNISLETNFVQKSSNVIIMITV